MEQKKLNQVGELLKRKEVRVLILFWAVLAYSLIYELVDKKKIYDVIGPDAKVIGIFPFASNTENSTVLYTQADAQGNQELFVVTIKDDMVSAPVHMADHCGDPEVTKISSEDDGDPSNGTLKKFSAEITCQSGLRGEACRTLDEIIINRPNNKPATTFQSYICGEEVKKSIRYSSNKQ